MLIQLTSKWFCAGVVADPVTQHIMRAAPIIGYMVGWSSSRVLRYARMRGWRAEVIR
jgi:hypothetical protein